MLLILAKLSLEVLDVATEMNLAHSRRGVEFSCGSEFLRLVYQKRSRKPLQSTSLTGL